MFRSRLLQVLLLLTCSVTAVPAKGPSAVLGIGAKTCKEFVRSVKDRESSDEAQALRYMFVSWVQGYFSARNVAGRSGPDDKPPIQAVGGTISADTLGAMLVDQCKEENFLSDPVVYAADALYNKLQAKGL